MVLTTWEELTMVSSRQRVRVHFLNPYQDLRLIIMSINIIIHLVTQLKIQLDKMDNANDDFELVEYVGKRWIVDVREQILGGACEDEARTSRCV